jgi:hypothetical protein
VHGQLHPAANSSVKVQTIFDERRPLKRITGKSSYS